MVQWLLHAFVYLCDRIHGAVGLFRQHQRLAWWEIGIVPVTFLPPISSNVIHRFVIPSVAVKAFRAIYNRHTDAPPVFHRAGDALADHNDWRVTFFPPYALAPFTMMSIPPALVLGWLISPMSLAADLDDNINVSHL